MVHLLVNSCLKLRSYIFQWREEHLHMPRNNLGGEFTRSLTGSPDAVKAVKHMQNSARSRDPMLPFARARELVGEQSAAASEPLADYLESSASLDSQLLAMTGRITQRRFKNVQERLGYFANRAQFSPPPQRKA